MILSVAQNQTSKPDPIFQALVEAGRIAAVPRGQLADEPQILVLGGRRARAEFEGLGEADERLAIGNANSARATLAGGSVRGYLTSGF